MQSASSNGIATMRLDIGSGEHKMAGWTGMDRVALPGVDVVHDILTLPWPFEDGSLSEARAEHVIEHIPVMCLCGRQSKEPFFAFFDEVYRCLKPFGKFHIIAPYSQSKRAWSDPTHTRAINERTFFYLNRDTRNQLGVAHYDVQCHFDVNYEFVVGEHGDPLDIRATLTKLT